MTRPSPPPDSVNIEHLQALISGHRDEPTLPLFSKPTHPAATRNPTSASPATPTRPHAHHSLASYHTGTNTGSHDASGNLQLAYPFDSQNEAGDTQVDSDSMQELAKAHLSALEQNIHEADTQLLPVHEQPDLPETPKSSFSVMPTPVKEKLPNYLPPDSLPDSDRFIDPAPTPPNIATPVRPSNSGFVSTNPLASYIANESPGFSMTQAFNAASSPIKQRRTESLGDSQEAPPTPSFPAARIMAKSIGIIPEEPGSPTQSCSELGHSPRPRALSAVLFSSPPPRPQQSRHESDDELVSGSQVKRRKAEAARKKGAAELANFVAAELQSCPPMKSKHSKHWSGDFPAPPKFRAMAANSLPVGQNAPRSKSPSRRRRPVSAPDEDVPLGRSGNVRISIGDRAAATQVPASDPSEPEETSSIPQASAADLDETWARLHGPQTLTKRIRHAKSASALRPDESPHSEELRQTYTAPSVPQANAASQLKSGSSLMPTSLRAMVPFNIPSPPGDRKRSPPKQMPSFIQESSGLEMGNAANGPTPNTSSDACGSPMETDRAVPDDPMLELPQLRIVRGATAPGTSSNDRDEERSTLQDSPLKRKRPTPPGADSPKPLRRFASLDNSQPVLSSREEPEDVDMESIVRGVGMGGDSDEDPCSSAPTAKRRKSAPKKPPTKSATESPLPAGRDDSPSPAPSSSLRSAKAKNKQVRERHSKAAKSTPLSLKTPVRKIAKDSRKPSSARQSSLRKSMASVTSYVEVSSDDDEDSPLDDLATTNPAFHISSSTPLRPIIPANRVFALWKDRDLHYYPATILSRESATKVRVQYDDDTIETLTQQNIRSLTLQPGDTVRVNLPDQRKQPWTVHSFPPPGPPTPYTDTASHTHVLLTPKRTSTTTLAPITVPITNLYLIKSLWQQFSKRDTSAGSITIPLRPSARTHTPTTTAPSFTARPPPLFTNMCFALSQLPADAATTIRTNGGLIVRNSLEELFKPSTTPLELLPEYAGLTFTAVIAPTHSRTPKFLQALALGVPCLAPRWVEDCVRLQRLVDWRMYLLPAGQSTYLECVHSRVLPGEVDAGGWRLGDVLAAKRRGGLMAGWEVDVYVPRAAERQAAFVFLVRALGAGRVREVKTVEGLKAGVVLCPDAEVEVVRRGVGAGKRVLREEDVVQALILGGFVES